MLTTFLAPLAECFDRWDLPGIGNDTEFAVCALIVSLCLVLLVSKLIAAFALLVSLVSIRFLRKSSQLNTIATFSILEIFIPPRSAPPLRI